MRRVIAELWIEADDVDVHELLATTAALMDARDSESKVGLALRSGAVEATAYVAKVSPIYRIED